MREGGREGMKLGKGGKHTRERLRFGAWEMDKPGGRKIKGLRGREEWRKVFAL